MQPVMYSVKYTVKWNQLNKYAYWDILERRYNRRGIQDVLGHKWLTMEFLVEAWNCFKIFENIIAGVLSFLLLCAARFMAFFLPLTSFLVYNIKIEMMTSVKVYSSLFIANRKKNTKVWSRTDCRKVKNK